MFLLPEGKSILANVLSILIAIVILGGFTYIIVINTNMWHTLEMQSDADATLREYSVYAAYDKTTCRGQDVMTLITKTMGDPFIVVCDTDGSILASSYDNYTGSMELGEVDYEDAVQGGCTVINNIINCGTLETAPASLSWNFSTTSATTDELQAFFLNGAGAASTGKYSKYKTYLIYDNTISTEIIGIVAVKEP